MRRISVYRPNAKLRGVERRLRALERWSESFVDETPVYDQQRYWNYKIPVLDRLVCPPTTTVEIQKRAIQALLNAAVHLSNHPLAKELPFYKVAVLLIFPNMWHSETTCFFDADYYQSFMYRSDLIPPSQAPSRLFDLVIPQGFVEVGTELQWQEELEQGVMANITEQRWTIGQL